MYDSFSQAVCEKIGYYVYVLKDPRDGAVFYIGKGRGNRVFQHVAGAIESAHSSEKLDRIRAIHQAGMTVDHFILRHGLSEKEALLVECACIDLLGLEQLTNIVKGHHSADFGMKTIREVIQHYDAKVITITEPAIIININKQFHPPMSEVQLYEATRSSWKVGGKRYAAQFAIASYRGLVREVYRIEDWHRKGARWEFTGTVAEDAVRSKYIDQALDNYVKAGSQNPIRYTF